MFGGKRTRTALIFNLILSVIINKHSGDSSWKEKEKVEVESSIIQFRY